MASIIDGHRVRDLRVRDLRVRERGEQQQHHPLAVGQDLGVRDLCDFDVIAAAAHEGEAAALVRRLKYGRCTAAVAPLADAMARLAPPADVVTWVPASRGRRLDRGFDQAELLARAVARRLRLRVRRMLRRMDNSPQTARSRQGRLRGPDLVPAGRRVAAGSRVLLVDDVATTGSTLSRAAAVLGGLGAGEVVALVATRSTPASRSSVPGLPCGPARRIRR